jgi:broad specificity phosphatase PhoE
MASIHLIRHGKAAAGFGTHKDPGLDDIGRTQAQGVADRFTQTQPLPLYSSPLARAYETALPLAQRWQIEPAQITIEPRVAEIPSPTDDLEARAAWLASAMQGTWAELSDELIAWREALGECLLALPQDCVVFSHYVAINAAVGLATGDQRMRIFAPDNCSVTTLSNDGGKLSVVALGVTADTKIN